MKNRGLIIGGVSGGIILIIISFLILNGIETYNRLVQLDDSVSTQWTQLEIQLERRTELVPFLTDAVKDFVSFDTISLNRINEAYIHVNNIDKGELSDDGFTFHKFEDAQNYLANSISEFLLQLENHPELKANENILQLRAQIVRTENQVTDETKKFNASVDFYNKTIEKFPTSFFAAVLRFKEKNHFQNF